MKDFEIRCDESRLETTNLIYGKFTLGPFLPGQATTFGNALRRSLLAELSGLAITAFEIIGVMQEFSTLPGLRESILDLSLNLKQIVLTGVLPHSTPPIGFLNVRGPAIIKANDLKLPAGVYCASPDQYIATLGSNGMLHLKFVVSVGKGYSIQPYSIYRSLSKIRLQPASNFDNIVAISDSVGVKAQEDKQLLTPYAASFPCEAKDAKSSVGVKDQLRMPRFSHGVRAFTPTDDFASLASQGKETTQSKEGFVGLRNNEGLVDPFRVVQIEEGAKQSKIAKTKLKEGLSYNVECERTNDALDTKPQTFNSLLTGKNSKALEDSLMSFANIEDGKPAFDSVGVKGKLSASQAPSNAKKLGLAELRSKEGLTPSRSLLASLPSGGQKLENLDSSQSPFFTNDLLSYVQSKEGVQKSMLCSPSEAKDSNSSYINIQTQLFQRITPHQVLPIDAVFTPVSQVNFLTEVNDRFETARENIVLEIWTNGSIHPKRALEEATLSLVQNFDTLLKKIQQASSFYKGLRYWTYLQPFKSSLKSSTESVVTQGERQSQSFLTKQHITSNESLSFPSFVNIEDVSKAKDSPEGSAKPTESDSMPCTSAILNSSQLRENKVTNLSYLPYEAKGTKSAKQEGVQKSMLGSPCEAKDTPKGSTNPIIEKLFKKDLHQSIYNLDIGNLNLSLQTFIFLKKAKIHTLLQLLTQFSSATDSYQLLTSKMYNNKVNKLGKVNQCNICNFSNEKIVEELNTVIRQFRYEE